MREAFIGTVVGLVTGAIGEAFNAIKIASTIGKLALTVGSGMVQGATGSALSQLMEAGLTGQSIDWNHFGVNVLNGTIAGGVASGLGFGARTLLNTASPIVNSAISATTMGVSAFGTNVGAQLVEMALFNKDGIDFSKIDWNSAVTSGIIALASSVATDGLASRASVKNPVQTNTDENETPRVSGEKSQLDEMSVTFKRNPNHDVDEFQRQLSNQEQGMNKLTVDEFLNNRDNYLANGRSSEGTAAQQAARESAYTEKYNGLVKSGVPVDEAQAQTDAWIKTQAALHDPDQVAGGDPTKVTGMGDARVNSSLGSQWRTRIGDLDAKIRSAAASMTAEERQSTYLNVRLTGQ